MQIFQNIHASLHRLCNMLNINVYFDFCDMRATPSANSLIDNISRFRGGESHIFLFFPYILMSQESMLPLRIRKSRSRLHSLYTGVHCLVVKHLKESFGNDEMAEMNERAFGSRVRRFCAVLAILCIPYLYIRGFQSFICRTLSYKRKRMAY